MMSHRSSSRSVAFDGSGDSRRFIHAKHNDAFQSDWPSFSSLHSPDNAKAVGEIVVAFAFAQYMCGAETQS
jgi:hypothetical protein